MKQKAAAFIRWRERNGLSSLAISYWQQRGLSGTKPPYGGKKSHTEPKLLPGGGAKIAAFALQNIHFSNVRYWRKADIRSLEESLLLPAATIPKGGHLIAPAGGLIVIVGAPRAWFRAYAWSYELPDGSATL